jgi:autotransporter passenger strand-loop-strand repeat protein
MPNRRNRDRRYQALFTSSFASATTVGFGGVQYVTQASIASGTTVSSGLPGSSAANIMGGAGHHDRRHHSTHGTAGGQHRGDDAWEAWAAKRRPRRGCQDHGPPHHDGRRHLARPTTAALPTGLARSPSVRPPEPLPPPGAIAPRGGPGQRLPLVALVPQWRQGYPNKRPPTRATANSAMGQVRAPRTTFGGEGNWCKVQSRAANGMCRSRVN